MAFKPFKFIGKIAKSVLPFGGGIVADILSPDKTIAEKKEGLELLTPLAQYNLTMARPKIMIAIVYTYLGGTIIRWIQILCGVQKAYLIDMPEKLVGFAVIVVGIISGTRGVEKIFDKIFRKKEKNK